MRQVSATLSLNALRHNLARVKEIAPNSRRLVMVKANAYGHGLESVAKVLDEAEALGVASIDEAIRLIKLGIKQPIVLMEGFFQADELPFILKHNCLVVLHHLEQVKALKDFIHSQTQPIQVWVKVNIGMHRLGFEAGFVPDILSELSHPLIKIKGLMGHFPHADDNQALTAQQAQNFAQICEYIPGEHTLANSAGILSCPQSHLSWVRPGLMVYGASPFTYKSARDFNLQPVMTLSSEVIALRDVPPGGSVGYGGTWQNHSNEHKRIAIVAIGYGDGYPWHAKSAPVLVNGKLFNTVGRVSMDMLAISANDTVSIGDIVTLWGDGLPVEQVANSAKTIPYELFCRLTERVRWRQQ